MVAAVAVGAGCGGDPAAGPESSGLGVSLQQANCSHWNAASVEDRFAAIDDLTAVRGDQITGGGIEGEEPIRGQGSVLSDDQAYELFENRCSFRGSDGFLLYKLYAYAAGFAGGAP